MNETLARLTQHSIWANARLVDFLIEKNVADEQILKLASHIALGERAWFQRIDGEPVNPDIFEVMNFEDLRELFQKHAGIYERLVKGDLSRVISYTRFTGESHQSPISDILLHLATHGAHHRGQIAMLLSRAGTKLPNLDFINFTRCVS